MSQQTEFEFANPLVRSKVCSECDERKPLSDFAAKSAGKYGLKSHCRPCVNAKERERYAADPSIAERGKEYRGKNRIKRFDNHLRFRYNLRLADYTVMLWEQGLECPICNVGLVWLKGTHVDHSHQSGKVRGILCAKCNVTVVAGVEWALINGQLDRIVDYIS